ncbi:hypothetical protein Bca101_074982 [Brassica carinata]
MIRLARGEIRLNRSLYIYQTYPLPLLGYENFVLQNCEAIEMLELEPLEMVEVGSYVQSIEFVAVEVET